MGYKKKTYDTIDNIVKGVCMDLGEGLERYEQYLHWALKAHKDWHLDAAKEVKSKIIEINSYKAAPLPDDFVDWTKVGIKCGNFILTFTHDDNMPFPIDSTGDYIPDEDKHCIDVNDQSVVEALGSNAGGIGYYFYNLNSKGQDLGRLYGLTAKDNYIGYFKVNKEREEIQFTTRITNLKKIYLEYISNGYEPCGESLVHPYVAELITLYIHWQRLKYSKTSQRWQILDAKENYWQEYDRVSARMFDLTVEDILDAWRDGYTQIPVN